MRPAWGVGPHIVAAINRAKGGTGELGNVGLNAAVANAVFHATGVRVRELPIRVEKLLGASVVRT